MKYLLIVLTITASAAAPSTTAAEGNVMRGAQVYRACVACHALEPDLHLTGPSLGGIWNRPAGQSEGFTRYSTSLREAGFPWNAKALDAWLADPQAMIEGTSMVFRGIADADARADIIAFLKRAGEPNGAAQLVSNGVIPAVYLRGQAPKPIHDAPDNARVVAMRHCGDGYTIKTANGANAVYWEKNIRLKIDSTETGPMPGFGVILRSGMHGDRYSVIFGSLADLEHLVTETCDED